jgi:hypothetical protein
MTILSKKLIYILLIFSICFPFVSNGQTDFRPGYYINKNNDTIHGLIDYKGDRANAKICYFKKDIGSESQTLKPDEILAYRFVDSKYFVSKSVYVKNIQVSLFLEFLINGRVDIYYFRDEYGEHYYIEKGDNKLIELKSEEKEVYEDEKRYSRKSNEYIGVLKYIFRESPTITQKIDDVILNHKSLIKIAHDYHNEVCPNDQCIIYESKIPKVLVRFGPILELNILKISNSTKVSDDYYYLQNADFEDIIYPSFGLFLKVNMPTINERLYLQYSGTINHLLLKATNTNTELAASLNHFSEIKFTENNISNLLEIRYEFPKGIVRPTFQIGTFFNYAFSTTYIRNLTATYTHGGIYYTNSFFVPPFKKYDIGFSLGFGLKKETIKKKEVFLDLKYKRGYGWLVRLNQNYFVASLGFQI